MSSSSALPRVVHLISDDAPRGAQLVGASLDQELRRRRWPSRVVALTRTQGGLAARLDVEVVSERRGRVASIAGLRAAVGSADVVVAHGSTTLSASALGLMGTPPFVYVNIGDLAVWLASAMRRARARLFLGRASAVAAISERSRSFLIDRVGVPPGKVRVLPNFRDSAPHLAIDGADVGLLRRELGADVDRPVALYLGSLSREKRPDVAIEVARLLPDVQVVLAGPGQLSPIDRAAARRNGVHVAGALSAPERAIAAADLLLLTSDTEGLPGVLIEAGMAGRPAASTAVGFVDEVVIDGVTGRLAAPGDPVALADAVRQCLGNKDTWGAAARQHCVDRFDTDTVVPQWERLLLDVTGRAALPITDVRAGTPGATDA